MQLTVHHERKWSDVGLKAAIYSFVLAAFLSFAHGLLYILSEQRPDTHGVYMLLVYWCSDFRYLSEQLILAGILLFVGAKFVETRKLFTVGFDSVDAQHVRVKGPDDDNTVWVGHRYGSRTDAEAVAVAFENRLRDAI
jgi:hypothetical protein